MGNGGTEEQKSCTCSLLFYFKESQLQNHIMGLGEDIEDLIAPMGREGHVVSLG